MLIVAILVVGLVYFPWFWVHGGATPGHADLQPAGRARSRRRPDRLGRGAPAPVGFWVSSLVFYLGFIWIFVDKRRRGWHDLMAGTVMVQPA